MSIFPGSGEPRRPRSQANGISEAPSPWPRLGGGGRRRFAGQGQLRDHLAPRAQCTRSPTRRPAGSWGAQAPRGLELGLRPPLRPLSPTPGSTATRLPSSNTHHGAKDGWRAAHPGAAGTVPHLPLSVLQPGNLSKAPARASSGSAGRWTRAGQEVPPRPRRAADPTPRRTSSAAASAEAGRGAGGGADLERGPGRAGAGAGAAQVGGRRPGARL